MSVADGREPLRLPALLTTAPSAAPYSADQLGASPNRVADPGPHAALPNTRQTSSVEGDYVDRRHDRARLGRQSRHFTHSLQAPRDAVKRLVYAGNRRHL